MPRIKSIKPQSLHRTATIRPSMTPKPRRSARSRTASTHDSGRTLPGVCAKFVTTTKYGKREVLLLSVDRPLTIGRHPTCSYVISDSVVSGLHCKLYAVRSSSGGIIVSCHDHSTNGLVLNEHRIRKTSVLLMDGDTFSIPSSQKFECIYLNQEPERKCNIFEPTPPTLASVKTKQMNNFLITSHCLGSGSFATVHLAMDKAAFKQLACKCIRRKTNDKLDKVRKEVDILLSLTHPNINTVRAAMNDDNFLYIFLELCTGGDLFSYIVSRVDSQLCEAEAKYLMYQLMRGLKYLHDRLISHRDLKPENILLRTPGPYPQIQIADFGLARPKAYQETFNVCGTVPYLPPEGILALDHKHLSYVGMPSDCWSSGVIMYVMLAGVHPFDYGKVAGESEFYSYEPSEDGQKGTDDSQQSDASEQSDRIVKRRIVRGDINFSPYVWSVMPEAMDLCRELLVYEPLERATVQTALTHRWFTAQMPELETAYDLRISSGESGTG